MTIYKLVVLGEGGVGKSCVTIQFTQNHFVAEYDPTIENSYRKQVTIDENAYMLDILDTAGQEEYAVMRNQYINSGDGFLLVYSITGRRGFEKTKGLRDKIVETKENEKFPIVIVANKCDLEAERVVTEEEGNQIAQQWGIKFFEASAKNRTNIEESFITLVRRISEFQSSSTETVSGQPVRPDKKKKSSCSLL